MSVEQIFEAISGWARIPTWYTSHPLNEKRFSSAIHTLIETVGTEITHAQFEEALRRHVSNNPPTLGEPTEWDNLIEQYAEKAMDIISYEGNR